MKPSRSPRALAIARVRGSLSPMASPARLVACTHAERSTELCHEPTARTTCARRNTTVPLPPLPSLRLARKSILRSARRRDDDAATPTPRSWAASLLQRRGARGRHVIRHLAICGASTLHAPSSRSVLLLLLLLPCAFCASLPAPGPFRPSGHGRRHRRPDHRTPPRLWARSSHSESTAAAHVSDASVLVQIAGCVMAVAGAPIEWGGG